MLQTPKIKNNATLPRFCLFLTFPEPGRPSKIVPKSMQKRLQNQLYVGFPLGTLKNMIVDVKTSPKLTPKISEVFQKSRKNDGPHGLWSKMSFGNHQVSAKSPPGHSQEPFNEFQKASKNLHLPPCRLPRPSQSFPRIVHLTSDISFFQKSSANPRCWVSGVRSSVSNTRCQLSA